MLFGICVFLYSQCVVFSQTYSITGVCALEDTTVFDGIKVKFERTIPSVAVDSVYTNDAGIFSASLDQGVYQIAFSKYGYFDGSAGEWAVYSDVIVDSFELRAVNTCIRVPDDISTIQAAIDIAYGGDTVLIDSGIYYENINFNGKAILLASHYTLNGERQFIDKTIIDGSSSGQVIVLNQGEDTTSVIKGLTIRNGYGLYGDDDINGGGILCRDADVKIVNCRIASNRGIGDVGSGVFLYSCNSFSLIESCVVESNFASGVYFYYSDGGLVSCDIKNNFDDDSAGEPAVSIKQGNVDIYNSNISNQDDDGIYIYNTITDYFVSVERCSILSNEYYGISVEEGDFKCINSVFSHNATGISLSGNGMKRSVADINNNIFYGNTNSGIYCGRMWAVQCYNNVIAFTEGLTSYLSAGIFISNSSITRVELANNIISFNSSYGIALAIDSDSIFIDNNCVFLNDSSNFSGCNSWCGVEVTTNVNGDSIDPFSNLVLDPQFVDTAAYKFSLKRESPCINAGSNNAVNSSYDFVGFSRIYDGTVDIGAYEYDQPLPVGLTEFLVRSVQEGIELNWATESEFDNFGWNVIRSTDDGISYRQINTVLIPGMGTIQYPRKYSFVDTEEVRGNVLYKLEQVDYSGLKTVYGPVSISIGSSGINDGTRYHLNVSQAIETLTLNGAQTSSKDGFGIRIIRDGSRLRKQLKLE